MNFLPRIRHTVVIILIGALVQYAFVYFLWTFFCSSQSASISAAHKEFKRGKVTCIIRDFDAEANDLAGTVESLSTVEEVSKVVVVSDSQLYPPFNWRHKKLSFFQVRPNLRTARTQGTLQRYLQSEFVLLMPDGTRTSVHRVAEYLGSTYHSRKDVRIWAFRVRGKRASCQSVELDWKRWTLQTNRFVRYRATKRSIDWLIDRWIFRSAWLLIGWLSERWLCSVVDSLFFRSTSSIDGVCDAATGTLVYLLRTSDFLDLPEPFLQPVDESILIQASIFGWKTQIFERTPFFRSDRLLDPQVRYKQHRNIGFYQNKIIKQTYAYYPP